MQANSEYDFRMLKPIPMTRATFARTAVLVFAVFFVFTLSLSSQINGVPASVTSIDFGGHHSPTPGIPASVTSLGPNGFHGHSNIFQGQQNLRFLTQPPVHRGFQPGFNGSRGHHHRNTFIPGFAPAYAVPYYVPVVTDEAQDEPEPPMQDQYLGGPTIFDRRGPGTQSRDESVYTDRSRQSDRTSETAPAPQAEAAPEPDQPHTLLVFKDGHRLEVQNYAILGDTLYDLSPGHRRRVALAELDLTTTVRENDDRGVDFRLPPNSQVD